MPKNIVAGPWVALQTPIPLHTMGEQRCFWLHRMVGFETHEAKNYCVGSGVAFQPPITLHPSGQQRFFGGPRVGVLFEMQNAKKWCLGFWGGAPNTHTTVPYGPAKVFLDTWDGCV